MAMAWPSAVRVSGEETEDLRVRKRFEGVSSAETGIDAGGAALGAGAEVGGIGTGGRKS